MRAIPGLVRVSSKSLSIRSFSSSVKFFSSCSLRRAVNTRPAKMRISSCVSPFNCRYVIASGISTGCTAAGRDASTKRLPRDAKVLTNESISDKSAILLSM